MHSATVILIAILFSALFSGIEIAFLTSNKLRLELDKKKKSLSGSLLSVFFDNPQQFISTLLVGNNIALVVYGIEMAKLLDPAIRQFADSEALILFFQTLFSTLIILITGEFLPKTIFRINPNFTMHIFAVPIFVVYLIFFPLAKFASFLSFLIIRIFSNSKQVFAENSAFTKIDLTNLLDESMELQGKESSSEHDVKIFQNALDFSEIKLRECYIPRPEIEAVEIETTINDLTQRFIETGYSKILVYRETIDTIVGYVHSSDLFKKPKSIKSCIRTIHIVPEGMPANKLMALFMKDKKSVAVVVDEFGGTAGMVTLEDIIEEIFGEIEDEHDSDELKATKIADDEYIFAGRLEIDKVNEKFGLQLPESSEFETIAGLLLYNHEHIPKINDEIRIAKYRFKVLNATPTRIELVKMMIVG